MASAHEFKESLLRVDNISLSFGNNLVLGNVTAEIKNIVRPDRPDIRQGQVVALLGPSGIGKTQLLRILAGLQEPTSGTVCINDKETTAKSRCGLMGVVFQNYVVFEDRTVYDTLCGAARQKKLSKTETRERVTQILEQFDLIEHKKKYPAQLSGGQRQRVAIAEQVLCSEHLLVMDEPFSGLDPKMAQEVCKTVVRISQEDELNTMVIITHDIRAAVCVADRIWMLGRDFDTDGKPIPGAYIKFDLDLVAEGLAWQEDAAILPHFNEFVRSVTERYIKDL